MFLEQKQALRGRLMIGVRLDCSARLCDNVPNVFYCDDKLYAGVTLLRNEAVFKPDDSACAKKREGFA